MRIHRLLTMLMVALFLTLNASGADSSLSKAFQNYSSAFRAYQTAVENHADQAEIAKTLQTYHEAKARYIQTLPQADPKPSAQQEQGNISSPPDSASIVASSVNPASTGFSDTDPSSFSADIQSLMDSLHSKPSPQYAESIINQLSILLEASPNLPDHNRIKYELAKACDEILANRARATQLYKEIDADPDAGRWGMYAKLRLKYNSAMGDRLNWRKSVEDKARAMNDAFKKYNETSWLALPVKLLRWSKYLASSISFVRAQNKESDFQLWFEELGAPFAPSVEQVFDQNQTVTKTSSNDENADIKLLYTNYDSWYARWKIISEARQTIDIQYFIIENDIFGMSFLGLLLQKAREGVTVRLMVDARGTTKFSTPLWAREYLRVMLRIPNIQIKIYNPIQSNLVSMLTDVRRVLSSNHDKIIVADGRFAIIGGRNIADEYLVDPIDEPSAWLDCDVLIGSPGVAGELSNAFLEEFNLLKAFDVGKTNSAENKLKILDVAREAMNAALNCKPLLDSAKVAKEVATSLKKYNEKLAQYKHMTGYPTFEPLLNAHNCPVKILDKHSFSGPRNDITEGLIRLIDGSRQEILIQNPYIVLTPRAEAALKRAAKRGVPIYIHTNSPQTSDSFPTEGIIVREWRTILANMPTCRMFARVNAGQLHAKNFVFDGKVSIVGTYNFDYLSEKVNSEVIAVIKSTEFAREMRREIFSAIAKSKEYRLATADSPEFGPENIESKKMWLVKLASKMGFLKTLF